MTHPGKEMQMSTPDDRAEKPLEDFEPETVEDLEVDTEDGVDVRGGTSSGCLTF